MSSLIQIFIPIESTPYLGQLKPKQPRFQEISTLKAQLDDLDEQVDHMSRMVGPSSDVEIDSMNRSDLEEQMGGIKKKIEEVNRRRIDADHESEV